MIYEAISLATTTHLFQKLVDFYKIYRTPIKCYYENQ